MAGLRDAVPGPQAWVLGPGVHRVCMKYICALSAPGWYRVCSATCCIVSQKTNYDHTPTGFTMQVRSLISWMDGDIALTSGSGVMFRMDKLIQMFLLSCYLRSAANLHTTLEKTLDLLLPAGASDHFKSMLLHGPNRMASASTMSRARALIDISYMLWFRIGNSCGKVIT